MRRIIITTAFVAALALTASVTMARGNNHQSRSLVNATGVVNVNDAYSDNAATAVSSTGNNEVEGAGYIGSGNASADATAVTVSNVNVSDVNCTTCGDNDAAISATGAVNVNKANTGNGAVANAGTGNNEIEKSHHRSSGGTIVSGNANSDATAVTVSNVNLTKVGGSSHR
jgi:hypothetical protein